MILRLFPIPRSGSETATSPHPDTDVSRRAARNRPPRVGNQPPTSHHPSLECRFVAAKGAGSRTLENRRLATYTARPENRSVIEPVFASFIGETSSITEKPVCKTVCASTASDRVNRPWRLAKYNVLTKFDCIFGANREHSHG